jgi:hypothetical protein
MSEIATAFIRLRANSTGFRSEAEASAKGAAIGAAKVFAGAFAAVKLFDFAKSAVSEAAQTQKATENIRAQFKGSSQDVIQFADDAAKSFGISKLASEQFASSVGLTGTNLGIGAKQTATMTIGLQKLAGSVGLIKGIDPASVFDKLQQALLGNTRGLKTLGISVDTTREKEALLNAGVIKATVDEAAVTKARLALQGATKAAGDAVAKYGANSSQAALATNDVQLKQQAYQKALAGTVPTLTAAQKAQAIYLLATKQLPGFLDQARKHSGDLADEQRKLSAEWANAKEQIGSALLPEVTALAGGLLEVLHSAEANRGSISSVFHDAGTALTPVTFLVKELAGNLDTVGPILIGLAGSWTTLKAATLAAGIAQGIYGAAAATVNTAQILLTEGTAGLAAAQAAQATGTAALTAEQFAAIASTSGLAAAQTALAASTAEAATATGVLDAALLANPFGLAALGVAGLVGGLIAAKAGLFGTSSATAAMDAAMRDARTATNDLGDALRALQHDSLDVKQAELDRTTAAQRLSDAQRKVTADITAGLKGTKQYRDDTQAATQAEIDFRESKLRLSDATAKQATDQAAATAATQHSLDTIKEAAKAADTQAKATLLARLGYKHYTADLATGALTTQIASAKTSIFAKATLDAAAADLSLADKLKITNPALSESNRRTGLLSLAAADLTQKLGHIPTTHQINVYYKQHLPALTQQAKDLGTAIAGLPNSKSISIFFKTGQIPAVHPATGGLITGGIQGRDSVPALLTPGELVLNSPQQNEIVGGNKAVAAKLDRLIELLSAGILPAGPTIAIANQTIQTDDPADWEKKMGALVRRARR